MSYYIHEKFLQKKERQTEGKRKIKIKRKLKEKGGGGGGGGRRKRGNQGKGKKRILFTLGQTTIVKCNCTLQQTEYNNNS